MAKEKCCYLLKVKPGYIYNNFSLWYSVKSFKANKSNNKTSKTNPTPKPKKFHLRVFIIF